MEKGVVKLVCKKTFKWCLILDYFGRKLVNEKNSSSKMLRPKILAAWRHVQARRDQLQLYVDAFVQQNCFVSERVGMKHDELCQHV
jgi:hypothetical protein